MTRPTLRRSSAAAVAVLVALSLAACGGDDDSGGEEPTSTDVGTGSEPGDDASDEPSDESESEDAGEEIDKSEFVDLYLDALEDATTATLEMRFGGTAAVEGTGSADFSSSPPSMALTITDESTGQQQEMIIVDGIMYLGLAPKKYVEYDLSDPNSPLGSDLTDQLDPSAMADVFEKGITNSSYLGEEEVAGETMEHYRVTLDARALLDEADLPSGAPTDAVPDELTFDLFFDDAGNFRRQEASLGEGGGSVELNYDNWGEPVDIKAPPQSQITEFPGS